MGLRSGLLNLGPPRRCVADLAAPIQLAPAAQQSKIKSAHQPPRSYRGQPVEAPQLGHVVVLDITLECLERYQPCIGWPSASFSARSLAARRNLTASCVKSEPAAGHGS